MRALLAQLSAQKPAHRVEPASQVPGVSHWVQLVCLSELVLSPLLPQAALGSPSRFHAFVRPLVRRPRRHLLYPLAERAVSRRGQKRLARQPATWVQRAIWAEASRRQPLGAVQRCVCSDRAARPWPWSRLSPSKATSCCLPRWPPDQMRPAPSAVLQSTVMLA